MGKEQLEKALEHTENLPDEYFGVEPLEKKCPRCGGTSANSSNPSGRCSACLKKLASNKKKPGHWQRAQTKADDALRRQKGKNGTAHKKSSGLGSRASIVKQTQSAEKKTGEKLSPDRKNNGKGYAASNTRMVPEKLNRGRHHVDPKKLRAWKKRLKKSETSFEEFYTYLLAKAHETADTALLDLLENLHVDGVENFIAIEELRKDGAPKLEEEHNMPAIHNEMGKTHTVEIHPDIDHLYNVKNFAKSDPRGKVKVIDIKQNKALSHMADKVPRDPSGWVTPQAIDDHIAKLPKKKINLTVMPFDMGAQQHRELQGGKHQYVVSAELHPETIMGMKPEERKAWDKIKNSQHRFDVPSEDDDGNPYEPGDLESTNQFGWGRIDPYRGKITETPGEGSGRRWGNEPNHGHWHLDELQSDFQNKDKINKYGPSVPWQRSDNELDSDWREGRARDFSGWVNNEENAKHPKHAEFKKLHEEYHKQDEQPERKKLLDEVMRHPHHGTEEEQQAKRDAHFKLNAHYGKLYDEAQKYGITKTKKEHVDKHNKENEKRSKEVSDFKKGSDGLLQHLSHGHSDPQHAVHSAVNALARKMGVNSISMDTPSDQAKQSGLSAKSKRINGIEHGGDYPGLEQAQHDYMNEHVNKATVDRDINHERTNVYLQKAYKKIGHEKLFNILKNSLGGSEPDDTIKDYVENMTEGNPGSSNQLTTPEADSLLDYLREHTSSAPSWHNASEYDTGEAEYELPVHQMDTYHKRPKKLGVERKRKEDVLGEDPSDKQKEVQYMKLHKRLLYISSLIKAAKS